MLVCQWTQSWTGLLLRVTDVLTTCAVKSSSESKWVVSPHRSVDGIKLWLLIWLVFDSEEDYCTGCQHQSLSTCYWGLRSPRLSYSTYLWNDSWVQTFHCFIELFNKSSRCSVWKSYNSLQICAKGTMWYVLAMKCTSGLSTMGCSTLGLVRNSYLFDLERAHNYLF